MGVIYLNSPNPYEGLFSALGMMIGNNEHKRQEANMYGDIAKFNDRLNDLDYGGGTTLQDLASSANPNSNYMGKNIKQKAMDGLFNIDIQPQVTEKLSQGLGQGLLGQPLKQPTPQQSYLSLPTPLTPAQEKQQSDFDSARKANPEWYRTGVTPNSAVYVGDRPDLPLNATVDSTGKLATPAPPEDPISKYSAANNPSRVITSAPKTLQEQTRLIRSQIPLAMQELAGKGYNLKDVLPLLQQATQDKIAEHTSTYNQQQLNGLREAFNQEINPMKRAMLSAQMKQYGMEIDPKMISALSPDYQLVTEDYGGMKRYGLVNKKDPSDYRKISEGSVVNTPYQTGQLAIADRNATTNARNADSNAVKANASMISATKPPKGSTPKPDNFWTNYRDHGDLDTNTALVQEYKDRLKNGDSFTPAEQQRYNKASAMNEAYWKQASGGSYTNEPASSQQNQETQDDSPVANAIRQAKAQGATKEEILDQLHKRGIKGYDEYVW